ncbi:MAG: hypothetical protein ACRDD1_14690, partial [Planctomycetia bacterium]
MGLRPTGAFFAAVTVMFSGFAVVHLDHLWAVEALPWSLLQFACATRILRAKVRAAAVVLPLAVAAQLLDGHFQTAFMTHVGIVVLLAVKLLTRRRASSAEGKGRDARLLLGVLTLGYTLAAVQLAPTAMLVDYIRHVNRKFGGRDHLATHALPPWQTAGLLTPTLYFREPLWREATWTVARTAPEECLHYVGLAGLALAGAALWRYRRRQCVRAWGVVFIVALFLAWGPWFPLYDLLVQTPGFSFFRAAARWTFLQTIAVAFLAGYAVDRLALRRTRAALGRTALPFSVVVRAAGVVAVAWLLWAALAVGFWFTVDHAVRKTGSLPAPLSTALDFAVGV